MSDLFGAEINPREPIPLTNVQSTQPGSTQAQFLNALFGQGQTTDGTGYAHFTGVPSYPGQLSPDASQTMLPQVFGNWQPWNAGTGYMANYIGGPTAGQMNPTFANAMSQMQQYGGIGGYPTQLMHNMAQFGGTGGTGNVNMQALAQFGSPSAAGQPIADMAKTGVSGSWGAPLLAAATASANNPALAYLNPFLNVKAYSTARGA